MDITAIKKPISEVWSHKRLSGHERFKEAVNRIPNGEKL